MIKIGLIGGGNMGEAIIAGIHKKYTVSLCEIDVKKASVLKRKYHLSLCDLQSIAQQCDTIILAVKPQGMKEVVEELVPFLRKKVLIVSIAAGITIKFFEKLLPSGARIVRAMPNMPSQIGKGITAVCAGGKATKKDLNSVTAIFNHVGETIVVDEKMMDAVTAVSGSGPAYIFFVIECLMKAARTLGFKEEMARKLVYQTVSGSVEQLLMMKQDPAVLRQKVTSKGGTTQAAMDVFLKTGTEKIFKDALTAAKKRSRELSK